MEAIQVILEENKNKPQHITFDEEKTMRAFIAYLVEYGRAPETEEERALGKRIFEERNQRKIEELKKSLPHGALTGEEDLTAWSMGFLTTEERARLQAFYAKQTQ